MSAPTPVADFSIAVPDAVAGSARPSPDRVATLLIGGLALAVAVLTITPWPVGVFQDDAIYVVLAKALASGDGFRMINLPGAPHATHFPPGYPLLLAALWRLFPTFPDNIVVFKFVNAMFLAGVAVGTYRFARSRLDLGVGGAFIAAAVGTISVVVLLITGVVLSEPLYMLLALPALLVAERATEDGGVRSAAIAGALIGVLALVRTVGVFLLPAALLVLLAKRQWRSAVVLALTACVFIVPWQLWISAYQHETPALLVGKYGAYGPWLAEGYHAGGTSFARAVLEKNADELFGFLGYITLPVSSVWPRIVSLGAVLAVLVVGAWSAWRRIPVTLLFILGYGAVILAWPFEPTRFVLVWWPVLAALFVAGVRSVWRWRPTSRALVALRAASLAAAALVAAGYSAYNLRGVRERWWVNIQSDAGTRAKPIAEWVARATRPDEVVISDHDLIVYLYTGRRAVPTATFTALGRITPLTAAQDAAILRAMLAELKPRWYIAASEQGIASAKLLAAEQPPRLRYAGSISTAQVYEPVMK
jgi:hypothetical protein